MAICYEKDSLTPDDYSLGKLNCVPLDEVDDEEVYTLRSRDPRILRAAGLAGHFAADLTVTIVRVNKSPDKLELEFEPYSHTTKKALGIHKRIAGLDGMIYDDTLTESSVDDLGYLRKADACIAVESGHVVECVPELSYLPISEPAQLSRHIAA